MKAIEVVNIHNRDKRTQQATSHKHPSSRHSITPQAATQLIKNQSSHHKHIKNHTSQTSKPRASSRNKTQKKTSHHTNVRYKLFLTPPTPFLYEKQSQAAIDHYTKPRRRRNRTTINNKRHQPCNTQSIKNLLNVKKK